MIVLGRCVSGIDEIVAAFLWREVFEQSSDAAPGFLCGPFLGASQHVFELGKDLLDWIEIGRIGGQEEQPCADRANGLADGFSLVAAQIVHDDDIAEFQCRD